MFDDPARDIAELSAVIKSDIQALNTAIAELQNHAARDRGATKRGSDHSVTVVDTLKTRLMGATKSFKEVLTMRQENVKAQGERRKMFSNESARAPPPEPVRAAARGRMGKCRAPAAALGGRPRTFPGSRTAGWGPREAAGAGLTGTYPGATTAASRRAKCCWRTRIST